MSRSSGYLSSTKPVYGGISSISLGTGEPMKEPLGKIAPFRS